MKIISGLWRNGCRVTVEIDGKVITRTVRYNPAKFKPDELYIVYNGEMHGDREIERAKHDKS